MRRSWEIHLYQSINRLLCQVVEWITPTRCFETSIRASPNASPKFKSLKSLLKSRPSSQYEPTMYIRPIGHNFSYKLVWIHSLYTTVGNEFEDIKLIPQNALLWGELDVPSYRHHLY